MNLLAIPPQDLIFEWERVRAGLVQVKKATSDDWLPEDVYCAIKTGSAALFSGEDEHGDWLGFIVLKLVPTFHAKRLDIWCAYSSGKIPVLGVFLPKIKDIAKNAGAGSIGFTSARAGWDRAAHRLGFKPCQVTYELPI